MKEKVNTIPHAFSQVRFVARGKAVRDPAGYTG